MAVTAVGTDGITYRKVTEFTQDMDICALVTVNNYSSDSNISNNSNENKNIDTISFGKRINTHNNNII